MKIKIYNYKFGNYANKAYRMFNSRTEWLSYMNSLTPLYQEDKAQNFNPGDGINTVIPFSTITDSLVESANYVMVFNDDDTFHSSWFITTYQYMLGSGYTLTLKRDLLTAYTDKIGKMRGLVKRGSLNPLNKTVLQFSPENLSVTKVKQKELSLRDEFGDTQWIVSYWDKDMGTQEKPISVEFKTSTPTPNIEVATLKDWEYYDYLTTYNAKKYKVSGEYKPNVLRYNVVASFPDAPADDGNTGYIYHYDVNLESILSINNVTKVNHDFTYYAEMDYNNIFKDTYVYNKSETDRRLLPIINRYKYSIKRAYNTLKVTKPNDITPEKLSELMALKWKLIKVGADKYYLIYVDTIKNPSPSTKNLGGFTRNSSTSTKAIFGSFGTEMVQMFNDTALNIGGGLAFKEGATPTAAASHTADKEEVQLLVSDEDFQYLDFGLIEISPTVNRTIEIKDLQLAGTEPYKMLAIPVTDSMSLVDGTETIPLNSNLSYSLAAALSSKYTGNGMYDIQIIPYAPSSELLSMLVSGNLEYTNYIGTKAKATTGDTVNHLSTAIFGITTNNRRFTIELDEAITVSDYKLDKLFKETRIVSPSGKSVYDFSVAMNDGLEGFDVDMTLKPVNSMIHINPHFKWLYGSDFNDLRGLIISEDLSMTQTSDAWESYKLQNLNFENSFNAQQEADRSRLNITDKYSDKQNTLNNVNAIGKGLVKTVVGGLVGGPGAAISAGLSSAASVATSNIQHANDKAMRSEMLTHDQDMAKRQFSMQMENIQNLPANLTKTSGFTILNKKQPYLEFYEASSAEQEIVNSYLELNGKNISAMGTLENYINIKLDFDYIEFAPYTSNIFSNMNINNELNTILSNGVYLCYEDKIPGMED